MNVDPAVLPYLATGTTIRFRFKTKTELITGTLLGPYKALGAGSDEVVIGSDHPVYGPTMAVKPCTLDLLEIIED